MAGISSSVEGVKSNKVVFDVIGSTRKGTFIGSNHDVSGDAYFQMAKAGGLEVVMAENFASQAGPGLAVYLSKSDMVTTTSLELGALQILKGVQTYPLPAGHKLSDFDWILVHCKPFNVLFGYAELK